MEQQNQCMLFGQEEITWIKHLLAIAVLSKHSRCYLLDYNLPAGR